MTANNKRFWALIAVIIVASFLVSAVGDVEDVYSERKGCERLDKVRSVVYRVLTNAADAQKRDVGEDQDEDALEFFLLAIELEQSVQSFSVRPPTPDRDPKDTLPDDLDIDCAKAYPMPVPASWFLE